MCLVQHGDDRQGAGLGLAERSEEQEEEEASTLRISVAETTESGNSCVVIRDRCVRWGDSAGEHRVDRRQAVTPSF